MDAERGGRTSETPERSLSAHLRLASRRREGLTLSTLLDNSLICPTGPLDDCYSRGAKEDLIMSRGAPPPTYGYSEDGVIHHCLKIVPGCCHRSALTAIFSWQVRSGALSSRFSYYCRRGEAVDYLKVSVPFTYHLHGNATESRHLKHARGRDY